MLLLLFTVVVVDVVVCLLELCGWINCCVLLECVIVVLDMESECKGEDEDTIPPPPPPLMFVGGAVVGRSWGEVFELLFVFPLLTLLLLSE